MNGAQLDDTDRAIIELLQGPKEAPANKAGPE